jgi:hypothetical protein
VTHTPPRVGAVPEYQAQRGICRNSLEFDMPAYLIVEITDSAKFQEYGDKVRPLVAKYGGRCRLARAAARIEPGCPIRATINYIRPGPVSGG